MIDALTDLRERETIPWDWITDKSRDRHRCKPPPSYTPQAYGPPGYSPYIKKNMENGLLDRIERKIRRSPWPYSARC
jgi:hypothetical protein